MKKYINKLIFLSVSLFILGSCSEDYLEDPSPSDSVPEDVVFSTRGGVEGFISGIIRNTRGQYTDGHDAGGLNSIYFARSVKGNDIIQADNWFGFDYDQDNREPTYRRTTFTWEFCYEIINQLNTLIKGIEESETLSEEDKAELKGQGLAMRGFYYFQLALEFQHTYNYDPSLPAPPIYTEPNMDAQPMSTMQDMYDLIISDLTEAVTSLTENRLDKSYINLSVANAILARVYQVIENWEGVEEAANAAYGGDPEAALSSSTYQEGFNDMTNPEWLWGLAQYSDQSNFYYGAPGAQTDHYTTSYQATFINANFVDEFSDSDVRKLFINAYGAPEGHWQEFITTKFAFTFDADIVLIRTPEMILAEAEAHYWQGNEIEAQNLLFALQSNRDPNAVQSGNTGDDLLEEILLERRKELYAEMGVEWFDAKRLRRGITRDPNHRIVKDLDPDDNRFFLKIPQPEIDANDNIDASINANR